MKIKITNNKTPKSTAAVYVEDLLQQEEFSLNELRAARHKRPIAHWLKTQRFFISDAIETAVLKFKLWLARF